MAGRKKDPPSIQETQESMSLTLGLEFPPRVGNGNHTSILTTRESLRTEEPRGVQSQFFLHYYLFLAVSARSCSMQDPHCVMRGLVLRA